MDTMYTCTHTCIYIYIITYTHLQRDINTHTHTYIYIYKPVISPILFDEAFKEKRIRKGREEEERTEKEL
jgi:hypothetical protein